MKVLIIDDNPVKADKIGKTIKKLFPEADISTEDNYKDGKWHIIDHGLEIDLLCLDWEFPQEKGQKAEPNGSRILELISDYSYDFPVIICSSARIKAKEIDIFNVKDHVYFRPLDPDMEKMEESLKRLYF